MGQSGGASWWRVCYQRGLPRLVFLGFEDLRTGFDQSSPVHAVSESRGGPLSVTDGRTKEILVSNFGLSYFLPPAMGLSRNPEYHLCI